MPQHETSLGPLEPAPHAGYFGKRPPASNSLPWLSHGDEFWKRLLVDEEIQGLGAVHADVRSWSLQPIADGGKGMLAAQDVVSIGALRSHWVAEKIHPANEIVVLHHECHADIVVGPKPVRQASTAPSSRRSRALADRARRRQIGEGRATLAIDGNLGTIFLTAE
ncbi:MAG: hypothetical protein ACR2H3_00115 [Acidimicrobiales bacterium]